MKIWLQNMDMKTETLKLHKNKTKKYCKEKQFWWKNGSSARAMCDAFEAVLQNAQPRILLRWVLLAKFWENSMTFLRNIGEAASFVKFETPDSTRCELVRGGLTTRAKPPQRASARTRRGRSARGGNLWDLSGSLRNPGILLKNVRDKGNPIEKCAGQRKSYRKMCGTKEIL